MKYPNIKFDFSPPPYQINIHPKNNVTFVENGTLTKFDKLLIESIIKNYDILIIERQIIIEAQEKKTEFLMKNKGFFEEVKNEIIKSKEFTRKNAAFLEAATENDRQFLFHKLVFCIQKQIKYFILNFSQCNQIDFAFLKITKHKKMIFDDSPSNINKKNSTTEHENHELVDHLMKNANLSSKDTQFLKKNFSKISLQAIKSHLEIINTLNTFIEEKQSFKFFNLKLIHFLETSSCFLNSIKKYGNPLFITTDIILDFEKKSGFLIFYKTLSL